jgi:hypothetical protein
MNLHSTQGIMPISRSRAGAICPTQTCIEERNGMYLNAIYLLQRAMY